MQIEYIGGGATSHVTFVCYTNFTPTTEGASHTFPAQNHILNGIKLFTSANFDEIIRPARFCVGEYVRGSNYIGNHHSRGDHGQRHENNSSGFMLQPPLHPPTPTPLKAPLPGQMKIR